MRPARLEDLPVIALLEKRVWKKLAATPTVIKERFSTFPQGVQIAWAGNNLAGFCFAVVSDTDASSTVIDEAFPAKHIPDGSYSFLLVLTVSPLYRRQGIASLLVRQQIELARTRRCEKIQVLANSYSRPLLTRAGFKKVKALPGLFKDFRELMPQPTLMELDLSDQLPD